MDPVTLVQVALAAGAGAGIKDTTSLAIKDAYEGLKARVKGRFAGRSDAELVLANHGAAPDEWQQPLSDHLAAVGVDAEMVEAAQSLMAVIDAAGTQAGKYAVDVQGSQGVQIGDQNKQHNTFTAPGGGGPGAHGGGGGGEQAHSVAVAAVVVAQASTAEGVTVVLAAFQAVAAVAVAEVPRAVADRAMAHPEWSGSLTG